MEEDSEVEHCGNNSPEGDVTSRGCCLKCKSSFQIFLKYVLLRSLGLFLYCFDILTDLNAARQDYKVGDHVLAGITIGLVFAPGVIFAFYLFFDAFFSHTGLLRCFKPLIHLLVAPVLPFWPIVRDLHQVFHGLMATCGCNKDFHLEALSRPSRAYLLKFLEAFTEAAPQLLVRLTKITLRSNMAFLDINQAEILQIVFSLLVLASKIPSTYQKHLTTKLIIEGELEENEKFRLPCILRIFAFIWWIGFLVARFEALSLFAGNLEWWIILVLGVHVTLVFLFQTVATKGRALQLLFVYLFGAFVFIFAYIQLNVKSRIKVAPWFSYTVYTILVFVENSVMLTIWYFWQLDYINSLSSDVTPSLDSNLTTSATFASYNPEELRSHCEILLFVHYGMFAMGLLFMIFTFCVPSKIGLDESAKKAPLASIELQSITGNVDGITETRVLNPNNKVL